MFAVWLIIFLAKLLDGVLEFFHAIINMRRSLYERRISSRMWYYRGFYDWTNRGHGVYIRLDNGKARLVRIFATSHDARSYLSHKAQEYINKHKYDDQLYAENSEYRANSYKVYPGDRTTIDKDI